MDVCSRGQKLAGGVLRYPQKPKKKHFLPFETDTAVVVLVDHVFRLFCAHHRPMRCTERRTQASEPTLTVFLWSGEQQCSTYILCIHRHPCTTTPHYISSRHLVWCIDVSPTLTALHSMGYGICWWYCIWEYGICWWYVIWEYGRTTVCGMVCVDGMVREKHSIWYGTFAVWYHGTMSWMYYMAKFAWWYGMFQYIRSVRVKYVVQISYVTRLYIGHVESVRKYKPYGQTDRQTVRLAVTKTETQFYKLRLPLRP